MVEVCHAPSPQSFPALCNAKASEGILVLAPQTFLPYAGPENGQNFCNVFHFFANCTTSQNYLASYCPIKKKFYMKKQKCDPKKFAQNLSFDF